MLKQTKLYQTKRKEVKLSSPDLLSTQMRQKGLTKQGHAVQLSSARLSMKTDACVRV